MRTAIVFAAILIGSAIDKAHMTDKLGPVVLGIVMFFIWDVAEHYAKAKKS